MSDPEVMLVGPRSNKKVTHGMSIAFDMLISGFEDQNQLTKVIDRSSLEDQRRIGKLSFKGILGVVRILIEYLKHIRSVSSVYITLGTSRAGFIRDGIMILVASLYHKPVVVHLHGGGYKHFYLNNPGWFQYIQKTVLNNVKIFIVLGELLRDQFYFVDDFNSKTIVVPNGLPLDNPPAIKPKRLDKTKPKRILYLSNMIPSKGYLDVLEACRLLKLQYQNCFTADFCGAFVKTITDEKKQGYGEEHFMSLVRSLDLEEHIKYHGTVRGNKKIDILEQADVFILPTQYPWEGQPISIIEAMAFGIPVITTRYRGIPELITEGYNGLFVEPNSPGEIVSALMYLWDNPNIYYNFSKNALDRFQEKFTRTAHLEKIIPIISAPFAYE